MTVRLENINRTKITEPFKSNLIDLYSDIVPRVRDQELQKRIQTRSSAAGLDRIFTSLKRLPFQKYYCAKAPDGLAYLCGKTEDMIYKIHDHKYNVGAYHVCVSAKSIVSMQSDLIHVFPDYDPLTNHRHLHHIAWSPEGRYKLITHPLTAIPSWCWASIGPSYVSALRDFDIVDIFRVLYIFLTRLNWSSPLTSLWEHEAMAAGEKI